MLAERSMKASDDLDDRLTYAFRRVMCRKPTDHDLEVLRRAYDKQAAIYAKPTSTVRRALLARGRVAKRDETLDVARARRALGGLPGDPESRRSPDARVRRFLFPNRVR